MTWRTLVVLAAACGGCNLVFGLEPPSGDPAAVDAPADDAVARLDAAPVTDGVPPVPDDGPDPLPTDAPPLPIDAPPGPCTPVDDGNECTFDTCSNGVPVNPPVPRDTLCNGSQDQCDGAGNCVECTTSGGCGDCCVCLNQVCIPA